MKQTSKRACAYCGTEQNLSREHIFPSSIIELNSERNTLKKFWLSKVQKEIHSDPVVKDVCKTCNNGFLSSLDGYGLQFFRLNCLDAPDYTVKNKNIQYNYHLLKRWALKVSYNSARQNDGFGLAAFPPLLPYISGKDDQQGRSCSIFLQISFPEVVSENDQLNYFGEYDETFRWEPIVNRIGTMHIDFPGVGKKWLKTISLRAVNIYLTFFDPKERTVAYHSQQDFDRHFTKTVPGVVRLAPKCSQISVPTHGIGAWDSFRNSRRKLVWEN